MSVLIESLLDTVALQVGDPQKTRYTNDVLLTYYNRVAREAASRVDCIRYKAYFDLQDDDEYSWPDEMTRMVAIRVSDFPSDPYNYVDTLPMREDEFRANTRLRYPTATRPTHYFVESAVFHLWPKPAAYLTRGGRLDYFGLPDEVADWRGAPMPLPDFLRNWIEEGMRVEVMRADKQLVEAESAWALWLTKEGEYKERAENRSADKQSRIVFKSEVTGVKDQV